MEVDVAVNEHSSSCSDHASYMSQHREIGAALAVIHVACKGNFVTSLIIIEFSF